MSFIRTFLNDLKLRLLSPSFWIMTLIAAAAYTASSLEEVDFAWNSQTSDVLYFWDLAQNIGYFTPLSLLCCTALNCTSFLNDYQSCYYRSSMLRSGKRNYMISKFLSCVTAGGLTLALGLVIFVLFLRMRFPLISENSSYLELYTDNADTIFTGELLKGGHYIGFFALYAFLAFLFGAVWSAVGICVSAFITDRYVASFSPYVIQFVLDYVLTGKFRTDAIFRGNFNVGSAAGSVLFAVGYLGAIIAVLGVIFCVKAGRRCSD